MRKALQACTQLLTLLQVDAIKYDRSKVMMAKRIYPVHSHVKYGYRQGPAACATCLVMLFFFILIITLLTSRVMSADACLS